MVQDTFVIEMKGITKKFGDFVANNQIDLTLKKGVHAPNWGANARLNTADAKAPITIVPSRPILTIPLLSENTPPSPVKIRGVE